MILNKETKIKSKEDESKNVLLKQYCTETAWLEMVFIVMVYSVVCMP
jgi:hypothetical protein